MNPEVGPKRLAAGRLISEKYRTALQRVARLRITAHDWCNFNLERDQDETLQLHIFECIINTKIKYSNKNKSDFNLKNWTKLSADFYL